MSSARPAATRIADPIMTETTKRSGGSQSRIGMQNPRAIARPPLLGMGEEWTLRSFGTSMMCALTATPLKMGTNATVTNRERKRVDTRVI